MVAALIADPRVRMVNFMGSTNVGRIIGVRAAQHLKPAVLELGGKNPLLILEDADPDLAVDAAVFGAFMNSGQICMSTDRIIIRNSLVETFIPRYVERVDMANNTEYGLTGGVISRDLSAALDVVSRVRSGIIHINDQGTIRPPW